MPEIDPVVIFAALAVIFAVINLVLWLTAWRNMDAVKKAGMAPADEIPEDFRVPGDGIDNADEKSLRIEDQLWGILDKLKEMDAAKNVDNKRVVGALKELLLRVRGLSESAGEPESRDWLREKLSAIEKDVAELKSHLLKMD